jgi:hypothetical protein
MHGEDQRIRGEDGKRVRHRLQRILVTDLAACSRLPGCADAADDRLHPLVRFEGGGIDVGYPRLQPAGQHRGNDTHLVGFEDLPANRLGDAGGTIRKRPRWQ